MKNISTERKLYKKCAYIPIIMIDNYSFQIPATIIARVKIAKN